MGASAPIITSNDFNKAKISKNIIKIPEMSGEFFQNISSKHFLKKISENNFHKKFNQTSLITSKYIHELK
jgi:hypothetical protein